MRTYVVIAAGGSGSRMGGDQPKQFMELNGRSLLWHSIQAFTDAFPHITVILVLPAAYMNDFTTWQDEPDAENIQVVAGGDTRFQSVKNGLQAITEPGIVFIHDAARCLVTPALIQRCYETALEKGSAIPAVAAKDSLRLLSSDGYEPLDRTLVRIIQTPQTFRTEILLPAFDQPYNPSFTDEATVAEAAGYTIHLVEGEDTNIKVTVPMDLVVAEQVMKNNLKI